MAEPKKASVKKEKSPLQEFEGQVKDIRQQFAEQLRCLETRTDVEVALLSEIQDYFKKRADVEMEYSRSLEKLAKQITAKHKTEKQKRDSWQLFSLYSWWQQLINETKTEARYRSVVADVYTNYAASKMSNQADELLRISKRCREIGSAAHQEILRVLGELHTAMKTYQLCYAARRTAETKFRAIDTQKTRFEETCPKKIGNRKHRLLERDFEKKQAKYMEFKLKALKARNEYLLCIDAANAALHKYFADDLSDLVDCMDVGLEQWLRALGSTVMDARRRIIDTETKHMDASKTWLLELDARSDKRRFLEANHSTFMLPRKFDFRPQIGDEIRQVTSHKGVQEELVQRYGQLQRRLRELKTENEEIWKTYSMAERKLMEIQRLPELKVQELFDPPPSPPPHSTASGSNVVSSTISCGTTAISTAHDPSTPRRNSCKEPEAAQQKRKMDLCEMEEYLLQKFHQYLLTCNLINRLEARHDAIQNALGIQSANDCCSLLSNGHDLHGAVIREDSSHSLSSSTVTDQTALAASTDMANSTAGLLCGMVASQGSRPPSAGAKPRKKRVGHTAPMFNHRPRLFGGSLEEYVEMTGEEIPLIIRSCVRMLSLFGLHHQGVFRVSGSQIEINAFKDAFERGEDPLADVTDASDVNSVAGVLKLYLRELREPLFPIFMFDQFVECTRCENKQEIVQKIKDLVKTLPRPVYVVMRYLFAFLSHLSEFSDENMMDPYNLAICFGPTLLPIPESRDQVFFHNHVNELVKNMIVCHEEIFPRNDPLGGIIYEKYLLADTATGDVNEEDDGAEDDVLGENGGRGGLSRSQEDLSHPSPPPSAGFEQKNMLERAVMIRTQSDLNLSGHVSLKEADSPGQTLSDSSGTSVEEHRHQAVWLRRGETGNYDNRPGDKETKSEDSITTSEYENENHAGCSSLLGTSAYENLCAKGSVNTARWQSKLYEEQYREAAALSTDHSAFRFPDSTYSRSADTEPGHLPASLGFKMDSSQPYGSGKHAFRATPSAALTVAAGAPVGYARHYSAGAGPNSPKAGRREGAAMPIKRLSLSSYGVIPVPVSSQPGHLDCRPVPAPCLADEQYSCQYADSDLIRPLSSHSQHQVPKGLSPTSLKEIQVELKAVLSSLESYTMQHHRVHSTGMKEAPFPTVLSSPKALLVSSPVSPPDLVQNLPSPNEEAPSPTTIASALLNVSSSMLREANSTNLLSTAETFAENKENTLKKGTAALSPQEGDCPARKQHGTAIAGATGGTTRPKPPIPKKPTVRHVQQSVSPQLRHRRGTDDADDGDDLVL